MVKYINEIKGDAYQVIKSTTCPQNRSAAGYGGKIPYPYYVVDSHTSIKRRVYAICYSNAASHYVLIKGEMYFLHGYDFPE